MAAADNKNPTRRNWLRYVLGTGAVGVAVTTAPQFLPYHIPEKDTEHPTPAGMANDVVINLALLNFINRQFAEELRDFKDKDGNQFVNCDDLNLAIVEFGGAKRTFQRVHLEIDHDSGGKVIAFREVNTDDPARINQLRLLFPGLSDTKDALGRADEIASNKMLNGERSPQIAFVKRYVKNTLKPYLRTNRDLDIQILGHSLGAPNALHAKHLLSQENRCNAVLFEPFAAVQEAHFTLKESNATINNEQISRLENGVSSIRSNPPTFIAELHVGNAVGNKEFGKATYYIDSMPEANWRDPNLAGRAAGVGASGAAFGIVQSAKLLPRRNFLQRLGYILGVTAVASTPAATYVGGKIDQHFNDETHNTAANARLLLEGDKTLVPGKGTKATQEEVKNPENYRSYPPNSLVTSVASFQTR